MVFHDVADGKTLKFWEMYYRYYFGDGSEPGMNEPKQIGQPQASSYSLESFVQGAENVIGSGVSNLLSNVSGLASSVTNLVQSPALSNLTTPFNTIGTKSTTDNIISNTLNSHIFGFNLPTVGNVRSLISSIDLFQVHAGRFNQVRLVNPRIAAFTHDTFAYAEGARTLELSLALEYEYAYYIIQNLELGGDDSNNVSTIDQYSHGEFLDLPELAFTVTLLDLIESGNPLLQTAEAVISGLGNNVQSSISALTSAFSGANYPAISTSSLSGLVNLSPTPNINIPPASIIPQAFASSAGNDVSGYATANLTGSGASYGDDSGADADSGNQIT
jgi:hypothetical protein